MKITVRIIAIFCGLGLQFAAFGAGIARNHGLPSGSPMDVLPQGAIVHAELPNGYQTLLNLERLTRSLIPDKAAPPDVQNLLKTDHPLMTLIGMQLIQEPITAESLAKKCGINPALPITASLYLGDPKKSFVISVPIADKEVLSAMLTNVFKPKTCEEITVGDKPAIRLGLNSPVLPELYVVCSEDRAFFCGDRAQVLALFNTPDAERLQKDAFMKQVTAKMGGQDIAVTFNPGLIKPLLLQLQQLTPVLNPLLHAQREKLLKAIPAQARPNIQMQLQNQLGVRDLEQFADFAEAFIMATSETILDLLGKQLIAFEGVGMSAKLDPVFPQATLLVFSRQFQPETSAGAIPLDEVRKAATWLGQDFSSLNVAGRQVKHVPSVFGKTWTRQVKSQLTSRKLQSVFIDELESLLDKQVTSQPIDTKAPWVLTTYTSIGKMPAPKDFRQIGDYFQALINAGGAATPRAIKIIPGQNPDLLKTSLEEEAQALNTNDKLGRDFNQRLWKQTPFYDRTSRLSSKDLAGQIKQFTFENAYTTHSGIFGYDQHEWINRRIYLAREVGGYLVYHQGARNPEWLAGFPGQSNHQMSPALAKLLDRIPAGVNFLSIQRLLQGLPDLAQWLTDVESLARTELNDYLDQATKLQQQAASPEEAVAKIRELRMPDLVYSLNREPGSGKLYCLLPGNLVYPREQVLPLFQQLLADYAAKANQTGGGLVYTRVQPGVYEYSLIQSTEGIACLITNLGNTLMERFLGDPEKIRQLQQKFVAPRDADPERLEEILFKNPRWEFLPGPKKTRVAKTTQAIPARDPQAEVNLLDLAPYYNAALTETWHVTGQKATNHLGDLPRGVREFGGVKFDVRGIIQLSGRDAVDQLEVRFPKEVKNIKVGQSGKSLNFFHATGWSAPEGTTIGHYVVRYANSETRQIPIVYGKDVRDWWTHENEPASSELKPVWTGTNVMNGPSSPPYRLFLTTWKNPLSDVQIASLDYRTEMTASAPFLIAITVEK